ncbi:MAG: type III-A CRISPR-associated RAMP protein Csm3 [Caldimicrobium sp.]
MFKYQGSLIIEYKLKALTGLRIGGSKEQFEIGGLDNPVIKTEVEIPDYYEVNGKKEPVPQGAPYIPGSSLKGKIRSLLEWINGNVEEMIKTATSSSKKDEKVIEAAGKPCSCGQCEICKIFGCGDSNKINELAKKGDVSILPGPPRLKVFDAYPTYETLKRLKEALGENIFTEIKTENQINRLTSRANPRKIERVPAGAEFEGVMIFDFYHEKDKEELLPIVFQGMQALEDNYLGGYGSRGSGRVKFVEITVKWRSKAFYLGKKEEIVLIEKAPSPEKAKEAVEKFAFNE